MVKAITIKIIPKLYLIKGEEKNRITQQIKRKRITLSNRKYPISTQWKHNQNGLKPAPSTFCVDMDS